MVELEKKPKEKKRHTVRIKLAGIVSSELCMINFKRMGSFRLKMVKSAHPDPSRLGGPEC